MQKTRCLKEISFRTEEKERIGIKEKRNVHMTLPCNSLELLFIGKNGNGSYREFGGALDDNGFDQTPHRESSV